MISSPDNQQLKTIRKLHQKSWRQRLGLFIAEGEDLALAAEAANWTPEALLVAGEDVEPELLDAASTLGSGTRAIGLPGGPPPAGGRAKIEPMLARTALGE